MNSSKVITPRPSTSILEDLLRLARESHVEPIVSHNHAMLFVSSCSLMFFDVCLHADKHRE